MQIFATDHIKAAGTVVNYLENSVHCVSANKSGRETESGFSIAIHLYRTLLVSVNAHNGILFCI